MDQLREALKVYDFKHKERYGVNQDGGYVVGILNTNYDCYISCGVANEESFSRDFIKSYKNEHLCKTNCFAFDGTISDYPWKYTKDINFIKKNISDFNDCKNTNLNDLIEKYDNIFMNMDIEGGEYRWLMHIQENDLRKFKQIVIEFHGVSTNSWGATFEDKLKCLQKLAKTHYIIHVHANNYGHVTHDIPQVVEATYVAKSYFTEIPSFNTRPFPMEGLDFKNNIHKPEIVLNMYPFCFN